MHPDICKARGRWFKQRGAHAGKTLAVYTSGGDSQGMNAALRAAVRTALFMGCETYLIWEGYAGMVAGGDHIVKAQWITVSSIIHRGGTIVGSARCDEFRERAGRLKAAHNLVKCGISNLVAIGGDGTLTGAQQLRAEWPQLLDDLLASKQITAEQRARCAVLHVVGIVGSIDNDFSGTDMTIGADSALHRIIEGIDSVVDTAYSHQRTFILEVMGRHCGYLALVTCLVSEADYYFIPEAPPARDWPEQLCKKLTQERNSGKRLNIVVMAEGALDLDGIPISAEMVKQVIVGRLQHDTRITVLGHVQRGGRPSAYDRVLGCRQGAEATLALMEANADTPAAVIATDGSEIVRISLQDSVDTTRAIDAALDKRQWERALEVRGRAFRHNLAMCQLMTRLLPATPAPTNRRLCVLHIGIPACGMNAAVHSFVRTCLLQGDAVWAVHGAVDGLVAGNLKEMNWASVSGWVGEGGANLGTKRGSVESRLPQVAARLKEFKIAGMLIVGGFNAYLSALRMYQQRGKHPEFRIPIAVLPASMDNNIPGTDLSLGADTSLNEVTDICDRIRQSAHGTKHRVFVLETMGDYSGYLSTMAGLAGGADCAYINEEPFDVETLVEDAGHLAKKMKSVERGLVLVNEKASENLNTDFIYRLYREIGKGHYSCRMNVLGHMQQGGTPSPYDRSFGLKLGIKCAQWLGAQLDGGTAAGEPKASTCVCGLVRGDYVFTPVADLVTETNIEHRVPTNSWWLKLRPLVSLLGKHESAYKPQQKSACEATFVITFN